MRTSGRACCERSSRSSDRSASRTTYRPETGRNERKGGVQVHDAGRADRSNPHRRGTDAARRQRYTFLVAAKEPILYVGPLTHRVYLTHHYKTLDNGVVEVTGRKYDVTSQVGRVVAELDALGLQLTPVKDAA
jgi:hypothetical protein